jgi:acylglycerol lipase
MMRHSSLLVLLLMLAACGPSVQKFGPGFAAPKLTPEMFTTRDGKHLPVSSWLPKGKAEAVIVALHGFNMYRRHFSDAGPYFLDQKIALYAYDQRGFGGSSERGIWGGNVAMAADVRDMIGLARARHPGAKVFILGSSMGAAVVLTAMAELDAPKVSGTILVAPAVWGGAQMSPFLRFSAWLAAHVMPWNYASGSEGIRVQASDNIAMLRSIGRDRLNIFRTRFDTIYFLTGMMAEGQKSAAKLKGPVLVLYGKKDEIIPKYPVFRMIERLQAAQPVAPRVVIYPNGWHMLLRDLQAKVVWRDIVAWTRDQKSALPSGFALAKSD